MYEVKSSQNEKQLLSSTLNTIVHIIGNLYEQDYESAKIEVAELSFLIGRLEEIQRHREKEKNLRELVQKMKRQGINIDFAQQILFLKQNEKNAVDI